MLGISENSTILRHPKVLVDRRVASSSGRGGSKTVKSAVPAHQATVHKHQNVYYTNTFKSVPTNLFRNNGSRYSGNIEQKSFTKMKNATLKSPSPLARELVEPAPPSVSWRPSLTGSNESR